jgi:pimeloyl-ACP methyl ester carboxylesterase
MRAGAEDLSGVDRELVGLPSPAMGRTGAGGHPCQGIYHTPAGRRPRTALIACHYNVDFTEHYLATRMARRGFGFLGWNTRFRGAEQFFTLDHALAEVGVGVDWLRSQGVDQVVLLGNSGGGSLMAAYQSQAREPSIRPAYGRSSVFEPAERLMPGDLMVFLAAHPGRPEWITRTMDPSVLDETDPNSVEPDLDMYAVGRGPSYEAEFVERYRAAQVARNHRLARWCKDQIAAMADRPARERIFQMPRTWADLRYVDGSIDPSNRPTPQCYFGDPKHANYGLFGVGAVSTLRTWLNMFSLEDSECVAARHLPRVDVPTLVVQPDADTGVFPSDARALHDGVASTDKQLVTLPGDHYFVTPIDARDVVADTVADWLASRTTR